MKTSILLSTAMLLAVAGCSNPEFYWYRAGTNFEEIHSDYCECRDKARQAAAEVVADEYFDRLRSPLHTPDSYDAPGNGDRSAENALDARTTWGELYERNAFAGCMKGIGYVRLKAHRAPSHLHKKSLPMGAIAGQ